MNSVYPFYSIAQRKAYIKGEIKALEEKMRTDRKFVITSSDASENFDTSTDSNTIEVKSHDGFKLSPSPKYIRLNQNKFAGVEKKKEDFPFENASLEPNKIIPPNAIINQAQRLSDSLSIDRRQIGDETIHRLQDMGRQGRRRCYKCYADNKLKVG